MTRQQPVQPADFAELRYVADPQISPDGSTIAFTISDVLIDEKRYQTSIWIMNRYGEEQRRLTDSNSNAFAPRWSPDSKTIAFLSNRSGSNQIWTIDPSGGEATQRTACDYAVTEPVWSPDGTMIAFTTKVPVDPNSPEPETDVRHITTLIYKADGEGLLDLHLRRHIFAISIDSWETRQITVGDWNDNNPSWTPCSEWITFESNRTPGRGNNRISDIWLTDLNAQVTRKLTPSDGAYTHPTVSHDGTRVTFTGNPVNEPYGPATLSQLWVATLDGEEMVSWSASLDRDAGNSASSDSQYGSAAQSPVWLDDDSLLMTFSDHGTVALCGLSENTATARLAGGERVIFNFSASRDGLVAFTAATTSASPEIFLLDTHAGVEQQLTEINDSYYSTHSVQPAERFTYQAEDGQELDAWIIAPPDVKPGVRYPMILEIHGGPHSMYASGYMHEFQVLANAGYFVLFTNPRGSTGYGQEFAAGSMNDWGGSDFRDVMAGLDAAIERNPIDPSRLGVTGGSYGGYLTNWIITQTDRFSAAVTLRSTANRHNLFGSSDLVWSYTEWEFGGLPFDNTNFYLDRSPISYVDNIHTPLLILHSEEDQRCPIEQSQQLFVALKVLRRQVEYYRFPGESHNLSRSGRPDRRLKRLDLILDWFNRYV